MKRRFVIGRLAERANAESDARELTSRTVGADLFFAAWQERLEAEGLSLSLSASLPPALRLRAREDRLAYLLTYYVGALTLSPHFGELSITAGTVDEERLAVRISAPFLAGELPLTMDAMGLLRLRTETQRELSELAREIGAVVSFDRTRFDFTVSVTLRAYTELPTAVRETAATLAAAIAASVARVLQELKGT